MKAVLHGLAHAGLTALAVGAFIWPVLPPPFSIIVGGSAAAGNFALGYFGHKATTTPPSPLAPMVAKKP